MMIEKKLIIPDVQELTDEQFLELTDFLDCCPVDYEIWELNKERDGS